MLLCVVADVQGIDVQHVQVCLTALGVQPLSQCYTVHHITESYRPCPEVQRYVHSVIGHIQLCLLSQFEDIYQSWLDEDIQATLTGLQFGKVGRLDLVYSLKQQPDIVEVIEEKCRLIEGREFQVHYESVHSFIDINKELARYFSRGDTPCFRELK